MPEAPEVIRAKRWTVTFPGRAGKAEMMRGPSGVHSTSDCGAHLPRLVPQIEKEEDEPALRITLHTNVEARHALIGRIQPWELHSGKQRSTS